ncbi:MAG: family transposase [Bradyrhizobium sp.]|nr:family transposase [Bradyrhizobium sp.]
MTRRGLGYPPDTFADRPSLRSLSGHRFLDTQSLDKGPAHPTHHQRRRLGVLLDLVSGGNRHANPGHGRRWRSRTASRPPRTNWGSILAKNPLLARLASARVARHARLRHDGPDPAPRQCRDAPKKSADSHDPPLIRWSIKEVRRIANRLAQPRIALICFPNRNCKAGLPAEVRSHP